MSQRLECVDGLHREKWPSRQTDRQSNPHKLLLGKSKVFRNLRHYPRAQSQGHHTIDRLEERGVERGSARRSSLKGRERVIVSQTNIGTVSKAKLGQLLERRGGAQMGFSQRIDTILNWTELMKCVMCRVFNAWGHALFETCTNPSM